MNNKQIATAWGLSVLTVTAAAITACANAESRKPVSVNENSKESTKKSTKESASDSSAGSDSAASAGSSIASNGASNATSSADPDSVTVSHTAEGPTHEWTMEEMLLAQPMPMSGEEREFVFSHKSVQKLHEWSLKDYLDYTNVPLGRQQIWAEGQRWLSIRKMVRAQAEFTRNFLAGKVSKPKPLPTISRPQEAEAEPATEPREPDNSPGSSGTNSGSSNSGSSSAGSSSVEGVGADGSSANGSSAGASSPGYAGGDEGGSGISGGTPSMNLADHNTPEDLFLPNQSVLTGATAESTFNQLKKLRTDISTYCKEIEELKKKAAQRRLTKKLDNAVNSVSWD